MNKLHILVCENYFAEYQEAAKREGFDDVIIESFPAFCEYKKNKSFPKTLENQSMDYENTVLICNETCEITRLIGEDSGIYKTYKLSNCSDHLINQQLLSYIISSHGHIITSGWLKNWKKRLENGGFDRPTAQSFYKEFCKELIFFDIGNDSEVLKNINELSEYLDMPYRMLDLDLQYLQNYLKSIVYEWRITARSKKYEKDIGELIAQNSDYAALLDIMHKISLAHTQRETIYELEQLFFLLFGARTCRFWGTNDKKPDYIESFISSGDDYLHCKDAVKFYLNISYDGELFGVLEAGDFLFPEHVEKYLNLSISIMKISALVISNTRRYELIAEAKKSLEYTSLHDSLTGLYNRTYFNGLYAEKFSCEYLSVFVCDVDNLKYINDNMGHLEGDRVIKSTAEVLKHSFRESDIIIRMGGDEFVVIGIDCNDAQAEQVCQRIDNALETHKQNPHLSFSVGYSVSRTGDYVLDDMLHEADNRMYENKRKKKENNLRYDRI